MAEQLRTFFLETLGFQETRKGIRQIKKADSAPKLDQIFCKLFVSLVSTSDLEDSMLLLLLVLGRGVFLLAILCEEERFLRLCCHSNLFR